MSPKAKEMLKLGESGRYEFKRDVEVVNPALLAALANWVAGDPSRDVAHLLVGVEEVEDDATGLVRGRPFGLPGGLDRAVSRIQDVASKTYPIPVDVFVVEEGVAEKTPFIRVEVRPTMPPHYDGHGRRQTRQGRSTRALTDDELLHMYLDREASSFAERFRITGEELHSAVGAVGSQVDQIADAIEAHIAQPLERLISTVSEAADAASSASSAADEAASEVGHVQMLVRDLQEVTDALHRESLPNLAHRVLQQRRKVWWAFVADTWGHSSKRADRLEARLRATLSIDVSLDAARNSWELRVWADMLKDRKIQHRGRGSQKWWSDSISEVDVFLADPAYAAPELPDLRGALKANLDEELDNPASVTRRFGDLLDSQ